jgi:hypothetical protein
VLAIDSAGWVVVLAAAGSFVLLAGNTLVTVIAAWRTKDTHETMQTIAPQVESIDNAVKGRVVGAPTIGSQVSDLHERSDTELLQQRNREAGD